jgi:alanine racemase
LCRRRQIAAARPAPRIPGSPAGPPRPPVDPDCQAAVRPAESGPSTVPTAEPSPARAWAEIDLSALRHNLSVARRLAAGREIMAVVKAGAYGHGLEPVAAALAREPLAFFGVANVGEARRISDAGITTPVYLLGPTWDEERPEIVARGWTPCLSTHDEARHFERLAAAANSRLAVHLAVDTGMGRGGTLPDDLAGLAATVDDCQHLELAGIGSHLPSADEDPDFTRDQFARFGRLLETHGGGRRFRWRHLANSAGLLGFDQGDCNLVRPGLMLYGISPLPGFQDQLRCVMSLKSRVTLVRTLPPGHGVSYGRAFLTSRPTRVATVGIGYGDGYPRHLSGQGAEVAIDGRRLPVLGRVTMDQVMVDASGMPDLAPGREVELFGPTIPVDEVAAKASTIPWEILTGITPRVTRRYLD